MVNILDLEGISCFFSFVIRVLISKSLLSSFVQPMAILFSMLNMASVCKISRRILSNIFFI